MPVTSLVRWTALIRVGGFPENVHNEDHELWRRLKAAGFRFQCVHAHTWLYRFHGDNRSLKDSDG